jgi:hypothetical protein
MSDSTEPASAGADKAGSVISAGTVQIPPRAPHGTHKPLYWWLLTSRNWNSRASGSAVSRRLGYRTWSAVWQAATARPITP